MGYKQFMNEAKKEYVSSLINEISGLFLDNNIDDLKMTDIAEKIGIGVASLYRYFETKHNLVILCANHLLKEEIKLFSKIFEEEPYINKTGINQMNDLLKIYNVLITGHSKFMKFLNDFDAYIKKEKISKEELKEYDQIILQVYPLFENAYHKGLDDNTIREIDDFKSFYFSMNHSLLSLCFKIIATGDILFSDEITSNNKELTYLIDTFIYYLKR